jgi:hypothetical protein
MTNHKHSLEQTMSFPRNLPWLAGAVVACAVLAAPAARAQTITATSATATSTAGSSPVAKPVAQSGAVGVTSAPLPSTSAPEAIVSTGAADITYTVSVDPNGGPTVVEMFYNLTKLLLKGAKSGAIYHTTGVGRVTRILAASDFYQGTLPIWTTDANGVNHYYTILCSFTSSFNTTNNVATGSVLNIGDYLAPTTAGSVAVGGTIQ